MQTGLSLKNGLIAAALLCLPILAYAHTPSDATLTMHAKTALYLDKDVKGTAINVDTINGRVTLYGTVSSEMEKARAAEEVNKIEGVRDVRNLLHVASKADKSSMVKVSDEIVKKDVEKRLKADSSLDNSTISVRSVKDGVVLLTGRANSLTDSQRALYCAATAPGVYRVASEIDVSNTISDEDFRPATPATAGTSTRNIGGVTSDLWITSATKMKMAVDSRTPATDINVDTRDGIVTLFGMVPTAASKTAAGDIAHGVSGVKRVDNQIEVVAAKKKDMVQARDEEILAAVKMELKDRGEQENADIDVEVTNGVVRLTGTVPTWQRNLSAVYVARSVTGVRSILNELKVEVPTTAKS